MAKGLILLPALCLLVYYGAKHITEISAGSDPLTKAGALTILIFSALVVSRYLFLLLFSMLNLLANILRKEPAPSQHDLPFVSVLVPCYNEEGVIERSLESLMTIDYPSYEIIVVDDGSVDDTYAVAKAMEFNDENRSLRVFKKPNAGKASALNYAIERSRGELFLAVDADSRVSPDSLRLMAPYFKDERVGAVAGSVYVVNTNNIWTNLQALEYIQGLNLVRNGQAFFRLVNIVPGPIGMFRTEAVESIGGYSDDTFAEDCDLTLRLIEAGYGIDYEIDAVSYTEAPESLLDLLKQRYRWTRGILQSSLKHRGKLLAVVSNPKLSLLLWYMLFEAILWPAVSIAANLFILFTSLVTGLAQMLVYWWIIFTILDISAGIYCVSVTKERIRLVFYTIYYRIFFINIINIAKVLATAEEFFGVEMSWGKLERKGRI